ncbi:Hypothetical predicted protein [Olea europaea subsp. europaea]|uniref:Legume-specific protein n=1 Tax=Olea europaea subsp. europaea TaxID=158383 RepID=A0A8S0PR62_OLEEU|nr:Hypothetical predicted protein [Olea europaea subsp. europaea]
MEGLIPFVYKAIVQYKNGGQGHIGTWLSESPSASYMRLSGDSGRFQTSEVQLFRSDSGFSTSTSPPSATKRSVSTRVQSPARHCIPRQSVM